ncbi:hypothetical protein [Rhodococcus pyridinivorans]|uniref:hypothetical protein n=1 Tax=Rhodococcus pyridinivorans TaxID=103816 RepID=UPI0020786CC3|nr:hypothetical protein [Rhodococcus pyridinivorans]USI92988.1 hypothetical protein LLA01_24960 [Rhodococcus pyridinivorans]
MTQPPSGTSLAQWITTARLDNRSARNHPDPEKLYEWSMNLSAAMMHDLSHFEVILRNSLDQAIQRKTRDDAPWFEVHLKQDPDFQKELHEAQTIAKTRARLGNRQRTRDDVVAAFPFGFWANLLRPKHEAEIWGRIKHAVRTAPGAKKELKPFFEALFDLSKIRNDSAHCRIASTHDAITMQNRMTALEPLLPEGSFEWMKERWKVPGVLQSKP